MKDKILIIGGQGQIGKGAYDLRGVWWSEDEIKTFTSGFVEMCFGVRKNKIKIVEKE